jgi:putative hydrolase of the HAD superfamily
VPSLAAVLFDLDDTLLDRRRTLDRYLADHAVRTGLRSDLAAAYRRRFYELDGCGYVPRATVFGQLCAEFPSLSPAEALIADYREHAFRRCELMEGAADVLAWCRRAGLASAIVTNGSSAMQRGKLEVLRLSHLVDQVIVSGEEGIHKPETELFRRVAARLGTSPAQCAFVGDNPHNDVDGARRAGMQAIWFAKELPWPDDLPPAAVSISALAALPEALGFDANWRS